MSGRALVVLAAAAALAGCGVEQAAAPSRTTTTETPAPDPVEVCANQLDYWVGQRLQGVSDTYEYQAMGLTGDQYEALLPLSDEAVRQRDAGTLPAGWVRQEATTLCRGIVAEESAKPSTPGWP
ncbi:hypothetical protein [Actinokineospora sp.]|uniref:hypothetical protein n=1 Tax=Actinokineospora sp. TaxID=1872133 RepID=UPI0040376F05